MLHYRHVDLLKCLLRVAPGASRGNLMPALYCIVGLVRLVSLCGFISVHNDAKWNSKNIQPPWDHEIELTGVAIVSGAGSVF